MPDPRTIADNMGETSKPKEGSVAYCGVCGVPNAMCTCSQRKIAEHAPTVSGAAPGAKEEQSPFRLGNG